MKNHLKRIAAPRTWQIERKRGTFITKPNAGPHPLNLGLPLVVILRDVLKLASTSAEVQKLLQRNEVLIDGLRRRDSRFIVGFMDVLSIPGLQKFYRVALDSKGRLELFPISKEDASLKPCKVTRKTALRGGRLQATLHDGHTVLLDGKSRSVRVGDTLLVELPARKLQEILPAGAGMAVCFLRGKHSGQSGILQEIRGNKAMFAVGGQQVETAREHLFILGRKSPAVKMGS